MASNTNHSEVLRLLRNFGEKRYAFTDAVAREGHADGIGGTLMVSIGIRETNLLNIEGDYGNGKGWMQIDKRYHSSWLSSRAGCASGTWNFTKGRRALEAG